jgi:hypothetical protein
MRRLYIGTGGKDVLCGLVDSEWKFRKMRDSFMFISEVQTVSDVHILKLASHGRCNPGIKFWQVLARRIRDACKHECRVSPPVDGGAEASSAREPWEEH